MLVSSITRAKFSRFGRVCVWQVAANVQLECACFVTDEVLFYDIKGEGGRAVVNGGSYEKLGLVRT